MRDALIINLLKVRSITFFARSAPPGGRSQVDDFKAHLGAILRIQAPLLDAKAGVLSTWWKAFIR